MTDARLHLRYLGGIGAVVGLLGTASLTLNLLVDPLWHVGGNRLTGINYLFDERTAKTNLLLKAPERYDCVIFGSSRTTLLDPATIDGHTCFNYAFSLGRGEEYVRFAEYARQHGLAPDLVIVGVDGEEFVERTDGPNIPGFIHRGEKPPGVLESYLSLEAVKLSLQTLAGDSPLARYAGADFTVDLLPGLDASDHRRPAVAETGAPHRLDNLVHLRRLRAVFPRAAFVGYVPPISPIRVAVLEEQSRLHSYLRAIHQASRLFDRFYDFSVPNRITADEGHTHDGSHYAPEVNEAVGAVLNGRRSEALPPTFGLPLHELSNGEHAATFLGAARPYIDAGAVRRRQVEAAEAAPTLSARPGDPG
jgi:hypothetical protein